MYGTQLVICVNFYESITDYTHGFYFSTEKKNRESDLLSEPWI